MGRATATPGVGATSASEDTSVVPSTRRAALAARRAGSTSLLSMVREAVLVVAIALSLSLLLKTFLIQTFYIPSESMENTLITNDRVVVSKLTPGPFDLHRGDIVVFEDPGGWVTHKDRAPESALRRHVRESLIFVGLLPNDSKEHVIKRVIGLPGDTVACDAQNRLTVNGVVLDETYLKPGANTCPVWSDRRAVVPKDSLWVMGDNRNASGDSRYHGPIPLSKVVGRAFVLVWPMDRAHLLRTPDTFDKVPDPS